MKKPGDDLGILLIGEKKPKGGTPMDDEEGGGDDAKTLAAEAFLKAIKKNDAQALGEAFSQMMVVCDDEYDDEHDDDESDAEDE